MPKLYFLTALFFIAFSANSQNSISFTGKVLDKTTQVPLESATVYLTSAVDSTMIEYTITDKNGSFSLNTKKSLKPVILKVSYIGYQTFQMRMESVASDKDFGILRLSEDGNVLGEVIVKGEAPPVRIKNDTLEFNASSFKLRPDANVEALLKQLPGVEINSDGKITVNGKEVNQVLVNGKPFFDKDGKIAIQSLPSDIINKVQITDLKTKQEEMSGKAATSKDASINLTIDEDKNKGVFGKFMGGYGSDNRYESSLMFNYFKNSRKISVLASFNNINSTGFSINEIFDTMAGGRNNNINFTDSGNFTINGARFGGGSGITRSTIAGINYADAFFKGFDFNGSYFLTGTNTQNRNRTKEVNLLPQGNFTTESESTSKVESFTQNLSTSFDYKIDSTSTLYSEPKFVKDNSKFTSNSRQISVNPKGQTLNESVASTFNDQNSENFANTLLYNKVLKKKGRNFSLNFDNDNKKDNVNNFNNSTTTFYNDTNGDSIPDLASQDNRNQRRLEKNSSNNYYAFAEFQEPIRDSVTLRLSLNYWSNDATNDKKTYDFSSESNDYSVFNDSLSNSLFAKVQRISPKIGMNVETKHFNFAFDLGTSAYNFETSSFYLGKNTNLKRNYILPSANANLNIKITKTSNIWAQYSYDVQFPTAQQILPVKDFSDPLNTIEGNENLDPSQIHRMYLSLHDYDYATKSGYSIYMGGDFYSDQIISYTLFDSSLKRNTTYANIGGNYTSWIGANWNKSYKKEAHSYKYSFGINTNLNRNQGFTNGALFDSKSVQISPRINFTYDYGELLSVNPTYSFSYNETNYTNYLISKASNFVHKLNLQLTTYWPKHVVFGNDFGYNYNSNIADGFKKDFYLWNSSLGYKFFSDKMLAKVKVYDILNQNQNTKRTINPTSIRDEENTVLRRYLMFSLTYSLEKFAGKKKEDNNFFFMD